MNTVELPKEIQEILKQVEANRPEFPYILVSNLDGIYHGQAITITNVNDKFKRPEFSGWKGTVDGISEWEIETFQTFPKDVFAVGYYSFWKIRASKDSWFWVSMPSMRSGESEVGCAAEIGLERVDVKESLPEDLDAMVRKGYEIIMKMVAERGEYTEDKRNA